MTKIQEELAGLPEEQKALFVPVFGDMDKFYAVMYLIARNEHLTELDKPERYEDRLKVIRQVRHKAEEMLNGFGLDGAEILADIASDYFEDYVNYKEPQWPLTNEEFLDLIRKISQAG